MTRRSPGKAALTASRRRAAWSATCARGVTSVLRGAQPLATKARNSSVVGRLRLGEVCCSSLITRPWCHEGQAPPNQVSTVRGTPAGYHPSGAGGIRSVGGQHRPNRPADHRLPEPALVEGGNPARHEAERAADRRDPDLDDPRRG